jgi:hypothetical protein
VSAGSGRRGHEPIRHHPGDVVDHLDIHQAGAPSASIAVAASSAGP